MKDDSLGVRLLAARILARFGDSKSVLFFAETARETHPFIKHANSKIFKNTVRELGDSEDERWLSAFFKTSMLAMRNHQCDEYANAIAEILVFSNHVEESRDNELVSAFLETLPYYMGFESDRSLVERKFSPKLIKELKSKAMSHFLLKSD